MLDLQIQGLRIHFLPSPSLTEPANERRVFAANVEHPRDSQREGHDCIKTWTLNPVDISFVRFLDTVAQYLRFKRT